MSAKAQADRIVRQWLETDAALGVAEIPVPKRAAQSSRAPHGNAGLSATSDGSAARSAANATQSPGFPSGTHATSAPRAVASPSTPPPPAPARPTAAPVKKVAAAAAAAAPSGNIASLPTMTRAEKEAALNALREQIEHDSAPFLSDICTRVVFGEGDPDAQLMFVGEGPGAEEDRTGRPFVGRSGQLLDKMIAAVGYQREQVFIGNVVKLRCADWVDGNVGGRLQDRPPNPEEVARGIPYLHRQIEIIRPKVIVTLGAPAVKHLTGTTIGVMKLRGTWLSYRGIPVMPTYHPSFVLRAYTPENRRKVWDDLKLAVQRIKES